MTSEYLQSQITLLTAYFGKSAVIRAFAEVADDSVDSVEAQIAKLAEGRKKKGRRKDASASEIVQKNDSLPEGQRSVVLQLAQGFDNGTFLPHMREVRAFLGKCGVSSRASSRKASASAVAKALIQMSIQELQSVLSHSEARGGSSDFDRLANEIMASGRR